jgi:hypothetical protein
MKFKVGDRVQAVGGKPKGRNGKVVFIRKNTLMAPYAVFFDNWHEGHSCQYCRDDGCPDTGDSGYFMGEYQLKLIGKRRIEVGDYVKMISLEDEDRDCYQIGLVGKVTDIGSVRGGDYFAKVKWVNSSKLANKPDNKPFFKNLEVISKQEYLEALFQLLSVERSLERSDSLTVADLSPEEKNDSWTITTFSSEDLSKLEAPKQIKSITVNLSENSLQNKKEGTMSLKPLTNFIKRMNEPLKTLYRLEWIDIRDDKYVPTADGIDEMDNYMFMKEAGLVKEKTFAEYATAELNRRKKAEL